jgi:hypothetical protein
MDNRSSPQVTGGLNRNGREREINLFEKEQTTLDRKILKLKEDFQTLVDSPEFRKQPEKTEVFSNCLKKFEE